MEKIRIYHFHNGSGGGVLSVIRNLLKYSQNPLIENHVIYTINKDKITSFTIPKLTGAATEQIFYYSQKWNFYYTCKKLAQLLPDDKAVIAAHDWLELGMVSNLGLQNSVVHVLHGDYNYYYDLARKHSFSIDQFIGVSNSIAKSLKNVLSERAGDIQYLPFPVPYGKQKSFVIGKELQIIFVGRLSRGKGYHLLPEIDKGLKARGVRVQWHIVAKRESQTEVPLWDQPESVQYYFDITNEAVLDLMTEMDFFVLPSLAEGMPVSLIEAMKAGVVPLVNNLPGGIQEVVDNGETGFKIPGNDAEEYAKKLSEILVSPELLRKISRDCMEVVERLFDPYINTLAMEEVLVINDKNKRIKEAKKVYGSCLDHPLIPNFITTIVRRITKV